MLLSRNQKSGIAVATSNVTQEEFTVIPDWLLEEPTPWNLVSFFNDALGRCVTGGSEKSLVNGRKAELRPAKILLDTYGARKSAELILEKAQDLVNVEGFTLWRVVDYGKEQVAERRYAGRSKPVSSPEAQR